MLNHSMSSAAIKPAVNVFSLDERRQKRIAAPSAARGNLYVQIHDDGHVDYDVGPVDVTDTPAMMMACLVMMMRLTKMLDGGVVQ